QFCWSQRGNCVGLQGFRVEPKFRRWSGPDFDQLAKLITPKHSRQGAKPTLYPDVRSSSDRSRPRVPNRRKPGRRFFGFLGRIVTRAVEIIHEAWKSDSRGKIIIGWGIHETQGEIEIATINLAVQSNGVGDATAHAKDQGVVRVFRD